MGLQLKPGILLAFFRKRLGFVDLIWFVVIISAITTGFFFTLLWDAADMNHFLSWNYIVSMDNFVQLGFVIVASLSIYILTRLFLGVSD